jgi:hypothetical protein
MHSIHTFHTLKSFEELPIYYVQSHAREILIYEVFASMNSIYHYHFLATSLHTCY